MTLAPHRPPDIRSSLGVLHGELLCEHVDIHASERVLDAAAGDGAAALAAARRWADVTATDSANHADTLDLARRVAEAHGLTLAIQVADADALPFEDDTFDAVLSAFGAMFCPDQQRVADELVRVCRPAGRIGLTSWLPRSLIASALRIATDAAAAAVPPATEWGTDRRLRELFGNRINDLRLETRSFTFRYPTPEHMLSWFRTSCPPAATTFEQLPTDRRNHLAADLVELFTTHNRADDGTLVATSDYLEVVAVIR